MRQIALLAVICAGVCSGAMITTTATCVIEHWSGTTYVEVDSGCNKTHEYTFNGRQFRLTPIALAEPIPQAPIIDFWESGRIGWGAYAQNDYHIQGDAGWMERGDGTSFPFARALIDFRIQIHPDPSNPLDWAHYILDVDSPAPWGPTGSATWNPDAYEVVMRVGGTYEFTTEQQIVGGFWLSRTPQSGVATPEPSSITACGIAALAALLRRARGRSSLFRW